MHVSFDAAKVLWVLILYFNFSHWGLPCTPLKSVFVHMSFDAIQVFLHERVKCIHVSFDVVIFKEQCKSCQMKIELQNKSAKWIIFPLMILAGPKPAGNLNTTAGVI